MNQITDEDNVNEAKPEDNKPLDKNTVINALIKFVLPIAAVFAVSIIGVRALGSETIAQYQNANPDKTTAKEYIGTKSGDNLGSNRRVLSDYGQFYDSLKKVALYGDYNSTTNLMTEGDDESDVTKTNGSFIYAVNNRSLVITDIRKGRLGGSKNFKPEFKAASDIIIELYVTNDNLVIITSHYEDKKDQTICYCYDLKVGDEPELIGSMSQDGSYFTSRKVNGQIYLFTRLFLSRPDMDKPEAISKDGLAEWVPQINGRYISYDCIYVGSESIRGTLASSFSIVSPDRIIDSKLIMDTSENIYVAEDAIYFYETNYAGRTITEISKMSYKDGKLETGASASVGGWIADSFAIRQYSGSLYVLATDNTSNYASNTGRSQDVNTFYVFDQNLKQTGEISDIARGERVYAARFAGDYAYFITYETTEPLFIADISDPKNPRILSELKVTGFSEYLHSWDKNHILGIGFGDREEADATRDIKLVMFDVTDPANPKEENQLLIKNPGQYCEAMNNYKAILAAPEKNLIGLAADDYHMYSYSKDKGFERVIQQELKEPNNSGYRGLYAGDNIYIASSAEVIQVK